MNNQSTIEKIKQMRLYAMAENYYNSTQYNLHRDFTLDQYLAFRVGLMCYHLTGKIDTTLS